MNYNNNIYKIIINSIPNGSGGINEEEISRDKIVCKVSTKCYPLTQNEHGIYSDNTIYVCSKEPLDNQYYYEYNGKRYTIRYQSNRKQVYYSIMEEVS